MYIGHVLISIYLISMILNLNLATLFAGFAVYGLGLSLISGSDQTLIYQYKPGQSYQHKIGIYNAISIIGLTVSSLIGGYLTTVSWISIFAVGLGTQMIAATILTTIHVKNSVEKHAKRNTISFKELFLELVNLLKTGQIKYLVITVSFFQSLMSVLLNFSQFILSDKQFTPFETSILISIGLASSAVASASIEKISKKIGSGFAINLFLVLLLCSFILLSLSAKVLIVLSGFLLRFSFEFVDTSLNVVVQELSNDKIRTTLISSINTMTAGLMFIETIGVSSLFAKIGVSITFVCVGIFIVLLTGGLYALFSKKSRCS